MTTTALNPTPSQRQQWEAHKARQARLWTAAQPANTNVKTKPVVEVKEEKEREVPMWERGCTFDAHVVAYRRWLVSEVHRLKNINRGGDEPKKTEKRSASEIIAEVLERFPGITVNDLKGPRWARKYVIPRHLAIYEVHRQRPDMSYPQIGRIFGMDHTSCLHAVRKVGAQRQKELEENQ